MKMKCSEGTDFGNQLDLHIMIPSVDEIAKGEQPDICIDLLDLLADKLPDDSCGVFTVPVMALLLEAAEYGDAAPAALVSWLDFYANEIRKKFLL